MAFHVTYNFVQGYDAGQKKIVASEMDQNFADIEDYINNSSVNIAETQTITGDKTFSGDTTFSGDSTFSGNVTLPASAVSGTSVALDGSNVSSIGSTLSTYMAHAAMPSGQYINLTLPASGGTVTAPADGWIHFQGIGNGSGSSIIGSLYGNVKTDNEIANASGYVRAYIPVSKNDSVIVFYSNINTSSTDTYLRFVYANGSAPTV